MPARSPAWSVRLLPLLALLLLTLVGGCETRLPAFANPPPVDAGADDDAGE